MQCMVEAAGSQQPALQLCCTVAECGDGVWFCCCCRHGRVSAHHRVSSRCCCHGPRRHWLRLVLEESYPVGTGRIWGSNCCLRWVTWTGRTCSVTLLSRCVKHRRWRTNPPMLRPSPSAWHALLFMYWVIVGRERNWKIQAVAQRYSVGVRSFCLSGQNVKVTHGLEHTTLVHVSYALGFNQQQGCARVCWVDSCWHSSGTVVLLLIPSRPAIKHHSVQAAFIAHCCYGRHAVTQRPWQSSHVK